MTYLLDSQQKVWILFKFRFLNKSQSLDLFRHTFATRCFEKGMTPRTVQEIMGHANYNTTVSYTHVLDDIKAKEAMRVGDFLQNDNNKETIEYESLVGIM